MMEFCILDIDYIEEDQNPLVRMFGVDKEGKSVIVLDDSFQPYFYILPKNKEKVIQKLKKINLVKKFEEVKKKIGLEERNFIKVFVDLPENIQQVRDEIKHSKDVEDTFEYSVSFFRRYMIDNKIYPLDWIKIDGDKIKKDGYLFDHVIKMKKFEKLSDNSHPKIKLLAFDFEVVDDKIIMVSIVSDDFKKVLTYKKAKNAEILKNEKELLLRFQEIINEKDPDFLLTFNGDNYDFEVLRMRCQDLKVPLTISRDKTEMNFSNRSRVRSAKVNGRIHVDIFNIVSITIVQNLQSEVFSLSEVSKELIGESKEDMDYEGIISAWNSSKIDKLVSYCLNDSVLTLKLGKFLLPQIFELSKVQGLAPFDVSRMTYGLMVDWFLVRKSFEQNIIAQNIPSWHEMERRRSMPPFQGAYVKEPVKGLHENIAVFDFRSLYPSIIVSYNISPETLGCKHKDCNQVPGLKYKFCKKPEGFIPKNLENIIEERNKIKEKLKNLDKLSEEYRSLYERQFALKILANATYGYLGLANARWYSRECAESAAAFGRDTIKTAIDNAGKNGFTVLYADTDSLFVKMKIGSSIKTEAKKFLEKINKKLPGIMELELQGIYKRGIFVPQKIGNYTAKKRYALIDEKGGLTIRGLETVRRDWCIEARNLQREIIRLVLEAKEKDAFNLAKKSVEKIKSRKIEIKNLAIKTMLGKSLEDYKAKGPQVVVARKLKDAGHDVKEGMIINYIITKGKGSISDRAEPANKVTAKNYDVDYYLNNQIIPVALRVLSVFGYTEKDFEETDNLRKFMKK